MTAEHDDPPRRLAERIRNHADRAPPEDDPRSLFHREMGPRPSVQFMDEDELERHRRLIRLEPVLAQLAELSPKTIKLLTELRDEEVETIEKVARLSPEKRTLLFDAIELTKSIRGTGRFVRWLLLGVLGIFLFFNMAADQVLKFWNLLQGGAK